MTHNTYCPLANHQLEIDTDGTVRPCCNYAGAYGSLHQVQLSDLFNSDKAQLLRQNLNSGIRDSGCQHCWKLEDLNIISKRQQALTIFENYKISAESDFKSDSLLQSETHSKVEAQLQSESQLISLDLKQSNLCNLKCRTCSPFASSKWYEEFVDQHQLQDGLENSKLKQAQVRWFDSSFWLNSKEIIKSVQKIDFYGGEPLADPNHLPFLNYLIQSGQASRLSLVYGTNGTLVQPQHFELWNQFKLVKIQLSQDGIGPAFEYLRTPALFSRFLETITLLKNQNQILFGVTVTFGTLNIMHLPETLNWLYENNIEWATNPIVFPAPHSLVNLPGSLKLNIEEKFNRISKYKSWMRPWLDEAISFMNQQPGDEKYFLELQRMTEHSDQWRRQSFYKSLPLTAKLFSETGFWKKQNPSVVTELINGL